MWIVDFYKGETVKAENYLEVLNSKVEPFKIIRGTSILQQDGALSIIPGLLPTEFCSKVLTFFMAGLATLLI